jgi:hypothetical protein
MACFQSVAHTTSSRKLQQHPWQNSPMVLENWRCGEIFGLYPFPVLRRISYGGHAMIYYLPVQISLKISSLWIPRVLFVGLKQKRVIICCRIVLLRRMCGAWVVGNSKKSFFFFPGPEFLQVVEGILRNCGQDDQIIFVETPRRIWMRHNEVLHRGNFVQPGVLVQLIKKSVEEFQQAHAGEEAICQSSSRPEMSGWLAPTQGWVKVNWDAVLDSKASKMGYGVLIQGHNGQV